MFTRTCLWHSEAESLEMHDLCQRRQQHCVYMAKVLGEIRHQEQAGRSLWGTWGGGGRGVDEGREK